MLQLDAAKHSSQSMSSCRVLSLRLTFGCRLPFQTLTSSGLYSGTSSLKNGKDLISVPSTYSMDSADVDLVETTV